MDTEYDELIILLHIAEGIGFGFKGNNIVLVASLGGNKLETEPILSEASTPFNNNLIWETDRQSIKRMKTENLPIKIECFESDVRQGQEVRNLIGYLLLPIRGVPIVPGKKAGFNKVHWYKLIGLNSEWRPHKPEFSLYLTITDKSAQEKLMASLNPLLKSPIEESHERIENIDLDPSKTSGMLMSQNGIHIELLQDEGLLQVGDMDSDCDIFIVKLMFKTAKHLEQIVNPSEDMNTLFRFHYNLLGTPTHCSLIPKGDGFFSIQEKIAIHFRTSLKSLREYFEKVLYIPITLFYNETIVGNARFSFSELLDIENLNDFLDKYEDNNSTVIKDDIFPIETLFDLPPSCPTPYVEYIFSLKYLSTTKVSNCEIIIDKQQVAEYIDNQAGGDKSLNLFELPPTLNDMGIMNQLDLRNIQSESQVASQRHAEIQYEIKETLAKESKSTPAVMSLMPHDKMDMESLLIEKCPMKTSKDVPRTFSFNLILQSVKFNRRPETGIWQISFHHQKADTCFTIANVELTEVQSNLVEFKNLELQLFFSSTADQILDLVASDSCSLRINGPRSLYAHAEIDNDSLLVSTKEKRSGVILMETQTGQKIAMAHIFVYLDDMGINLNSQLKRHCTPFGEQNNTAPYMDENLAYKIVEELEDWKNKQQEIFLVELKRKEISYLAKLSAEWQKKKAEQENQLADKLDECTALSETLEAAHRTLQEKGIEKIEQEQLEERARSEVEKNYAKKFLELNEKCRRIQDDMTHQLKLETLRFRELEMTKDALVNENIRLGNDLEELTAKYNEMKQSFLPKEQLAGLFQDVRILNERLEETQKSKIFYKEQWAKIIREVHKMKSENLKKIEARLKQCRTSASIEGFLDAEQNELYSDRSELDDIKQVLNSDDDDESVCSIIDFD